MFIISLILLLHGCVIKSARVPQIIRDNGYPFESHIVTTEDGYILNIFRIPNNGRETKLQPILLSHGLGGSSADFIFLGPGHSLGFVLSDQGYDVWLMNNRGTIYSEDHLTLNPVESQFWNYSFNEIGTYDLPSTIDYILNITGSDKLFHVGMSQGCTSFYIMLSEKPEYNNKLLGHISLAPAVFLCGVSNSLYAIGGVFEYFGWFSELVRNIGGYFNSYPQAPVLRDLVKLLCNCDGDSCLICKQIMYSMFDVQQFKNFNYEYLLNLVTVFPAGASLKSLLHYAQAITSCEFRNFRYSREMVPKQYNLQNTKVPVFVITGDRDNLVTPKDTLRLNTSLPNGFNETVFVKGYGHTDIIFAYNINEMVNNKLIDFLRRMTA